jgi:methionine-rich copper-binding protein CopC
MIRGFRYGFTVGVTFVCLVGFSRSVAAHAILVKAIPAADSTVNGPDIEVKLSFNVRIDRGRSRLILALPNGKSVMLKILEEGGPDSLSARATELTPGSYTLRWQVLASDGHITGGVVPFRVNGP